MTAELVCGTGDRAAWLEARRAGITATDVPVILGLVTWDSPFALYWRKKGKLPDVEESDRMRLGSWLEASIAEQWGRSQYLFGDLWVITEPTGLYRSAERPWQLATPDRLSEDGEPLECKTSATRDHWGPDRTAEVPAHVRAQVLWQMDTLGVSTGHVAVVFLPSGEFRSYTISHHPQDLAEVAATGIACDACNDQRLMREKAEEFWRRLQDDDPPPVDGLQVTTDALRFLNAGAVKGKRAEVPLESWNPWYGASEEVKRWTGLKRQYENEIRAAMGDATIATVDGEPVARREVFKRAGYEVPPGEVDRLVRVKPKEAKGE